MFVLSNMFRLSTRITNISTRITINQITATWPVIPWTECAIHERPSIINRLWRWVRYYIWFREYLRTFAWKFRQKYNIVHMSLPYNTINTSSYFCGFPSSPGSELVVQMKVALSSWLVICRDNVLLAVNLQSVLGVSSCSIPSCTFWYMWGASAKVYNQLWWKKFSSL